MVYSTPVTKNILVGIVISACLVGLVVYDKFIVDKYGPRYRECDPMNIKLCQIGEYKIGGWPFSHFYIHFLLGLVAPGQWHLWTSMGIGWELCEYIAGFNTHSFHDENDTMVYTKHFYGNKFDPLSNVLGMCCGILANKIIYTFVDDK
jgi:hypothetical protein